MILRLLCDCSTETRTTYCPPGCTSGIIDIDPRDDEGAYFPEEMLDLAVFEARRLRGGYQTPDGEWLYPSPAVMPQGVRLCNLGDERAPRLTRP